MEDYQGQPITLELSLRPLETYHEGVPHILSLCDRSGREIFYLGQWKNHMVMRLVDDKRRLTRSKQEQGTFDYLHAGQNAFLTLVFDGGKTRLYSDGGLTEVNDGFELTSAIYHRPVRSVILGNSSRGDSPWKGEIQGFSVFTGALDPAAILERFHRSTEGENHLPMGEVIHYQFDTPLSETVRNSAGQKWDLQIPEKLAPLRRAYLALPEAENFGKKWFYVDALLNLAGFIPLGLILAMLFYSRGSLIRTRTIALILTAGFLFSLFIETNQVFLVTRDSSLTDLVLNTLGTGIGFLVFLALSRTTFSGISGQQ